MKITSNSYYGTTSYRVKFWFKDNAYNHVHEKWSDITVQIIQDCSALETITTYPIADTEYTFKRAMLTKSFTYFTSSLPAPCPLEHSLEAMDASGNWVSTNDEFINLLTFSNSSNSMNVYYDVNN